MSPSARDARDDALVGYLSRRAGLAVGGPRRDVLRRAVARVAPDRGGQQPAAAVLRLASDEDAFARLCDDVTVQESYFWRERTHLDLLRVRIVEELCPSGEETLRVWSAGCARGEEAYTLAMVLTAAGLDGRYHVLGTDISAAAVCAAQRATYGPWALRGLDHSTMSRLFTREGDRFRVRGKYRADVEFGVHNILDLSPPRRLPFDVIFCRNLLIYLTGEAVGLAAKRLVGALTPGGWLVTGAADPLLEGVEGLETVSTEHGLAYRRSGDGPRARFATAIPEARRQPQQPRPAVPSRSGRTSDVPKERTADALAPVVEDVRALIAEGELALGRAKPRTAECVAHRALAVAPMSSAAHRLLVQALAQGGTLVEAAEAATAAAALFPTDAETQHLHAAVLLESGSAADAKTVAQRAVYLDPAMIPAYLLLSRACELLGDHVAARRARRNARRLLAREQDRT